MGDDNVVLYYKPQGADDDKAGLKRSGTVRQPKLAATRVLGGSTAKHTVTSSVILLHNPTFNALTAIS